MRRRLLALLLALTMVVSILPVSVFATDTVPEATKGPLVSSKICAKKFYKRCIIIPDVLTTICKTGTIYLHNCPRNTWRGAAKLSPATQ